MSEVYLTIKVKPTIIVKLKQFKETRDIALATEIADDLIEQVRN